MWFVFIFSYCFIRSQNKSNFIDHQTTIVTILYATQKYRRLLTLCPSHKRTTGSKYKYKAPKYSIQLLKTNKIEEKPVCFNLWLILFEHFIAFSVFSSVFFGLFFVFCFFFILATLRVFKIYELRITITFWKFSTFINRIDHNNNLI